MRNKTSSISNNSTPSMSMIEVVLLAAGLWSLNAFAIDMMLPALGIISQELGAQNDNDRQLMIIVYLLFNGVAQLFYGPLVDRFGRRPILLFALFGYVLGSVLSLMASGFSFMLFARALQGAATAGARVASLAIIRDQFAGRKMAQVMSLVITVFMAAPIIAPSIGQVILYFGPWRWIFAALMLYGLFFSLWVLVRLKETLPTEQRVPLVFGNIVNNYVQFFKNRISLCYSLSNALMFAGLFGYISASEQIFIETYQLGNLFALAFAVIALPLALATIINARLVNKHGMRRISHVASVGYIISAIGHFIVFHMGLENLYVFQFFMGFSFFTLGLLGPNNTAIAMEPMGHIAGSAGAANGFMGTAFSALIGGMIGRAYDGTPGPIILGLLVLGVLAFGITWIAERGKLFEPYTDR